MGSNYPHKKTALVWGDYMTGRDRVRGLGEGIGVAYRDERGNTLMVDDSMATRSHLTQQVNSQIPGLLIDPRS